MWLPRESRPKNRRRGSMHSAATKLKDTFSTVRNRPRMFANFCIWYIEEESKRQPVYGPPFEAGVRGEKPVCQHHSALHDRTFVAECAEAPRAVRAAHPRRVDPTEGHVAVREL